MRYTKAIVFSVVLALLLAACAPTPQIVEVTKEVVKEKEVITTVEVEVEKEVITTVEVEKEVVETVEVEKIITATPLPPNLPKGTLTVGIPTNIETIDPVRGPMVQVQNVAAIPFESLVFMNEKGEILPLLAESWENPDDLTFIFHLREGVKFHNGEDFNADSVLASWEYHKGSDKSFAFVSVESMEKLDDYTVKVTTAEPDPIFLRRMGADFASMLPAQYIEEVGVEGFGQAPIGTSPFKFKEWVRGDRVVFEANPDYWGGPGKAGVETVVIKTIPEAGARVAALQAGEIDIALLVPPAQVGLIMDDPNLRVQRVLSTRPFYVMFNNITTGIGTPIEDARVRRAIIHSVDRWAIIDALFQGNGQVMNSLIGEPQFGYDPSVEPITYDPERAKELLAEAGYPDGFEIGFACPTGAYAVDDKACQAIAGYMEEVGIKVDLQVREANTHWDLEANHELEPLFFDATGDRVMDAALALIVVDKNVIWTSWYSDWLQELIEAGGSTTDQAKRQEVYSELQRRWQEDPPGMALWQVHNFTGVNNRVQGFVPYPNELLYVWGITVTE